MDVPREMMQSMGERGRDAIVAGLSPVNGIIRQSEINFHGRLRSTFAKTVSFDEVRVYFPELGSFGHLSQLPP